MIITTIIPIFLLIALGWYAGRRGFMPAEFVGPANRLVFYLALPAMVFNAISKASLKSEFHPGVLGVTLAALIAAFFLIWCGCLISGASQEKRGTFIQSGFHGNLGYIGLTVAFYFLGENGLVKAGLTAGFMMILQNMLAVIALQVNSPQHGRADHNWSQSAVKIVGNPIILSALAGMAASAAGVGMPMVVDRTLQLMSQMASPLALLVIGASLSFGLIRREMVPAVICAFCKLILLPAIGWWGFRLLSIAPDDYLPALILLASPTATIVYVMGGEMGGDPDLAAATISLSTLVSALTLTLWLNVR